MIEESMDAANQTRRKRWNRRSSDGAAWSWESDSDFFENNDDDGEQRRGYSCLALRRMVASAEPLFGHEPIQWTDEFRDRIAAASRASAVSFAIFAMLSFSGQDYIPAAWIGNVLALSTLKPTLGGTFLATKDVFIPILPVACISWGVASVLDSLSTTLYSILLPFVVMSGCLVLLLCPWPYMTMKNLMLLIFYIIVASPLSLRYSGYEKDTDIEQKNLGSWFALGLAASSAIGLSVALLVHLLLLLAPRSTTAIRSSRRLTKRLSYQTYELLQSISEYTQHIGKASEIARQSRTLIQYYTKSRQHTLEQLEKLMPAIRAERKLSTKLTSSYVDTMQDFLSCAKKQQHHAEIVRLATTQQFLGEDFTSSNEKVRDVKAQISTNLGYAIEQLMLMYAKAENAFLFEGSNKRKQSSQGLQSCIENYSMAMQQAITDVEALLLNDYDASRSAASPMIRQRVAFTGVFSFVHELHETMNTINAEIPREEVSKKILPKLASTLKMSWLCNDPGQKRLAAKTTLALGLASLWVVIPFFRGYVAYPSSIWVGVTVASVSLSTTGSSYTKSLDRLFGTLVAAGYCLLIGKLFDPSNSIVKLFALSCFTFVSTLLENHDRSYATRYAATSCGSILYGSFDNGVAVEDYVPIRIMLIFLGVVTVLFIDMVVFPRSSRTIVEGYSLQFFEDLEHCLFDSSKVCGAISSIHTSSPSNEKDLASLADKDPLWMLRSGQKEIVLTDDLAETADSAKHTVALSLSELRSGAAEPSLGLSVRLNLIGYNNLLAEQSLICSQLGLLIVTIKSLVGYYTRLPKDSQVRSLHWPSLLSSILVKIAQRLSQTTDKLKLVFPHGLLRCSGACDISQVVRAVATFRGFEDTVLSILSDAEDQNASYFSLVSSSGNEVRYTPGFRLTLALAVSSILNIGQSLTNCGQHLETILQSFPVDDVRSSQPAQQARQTMDVGRIDIVAG